MLFHVYIEVDLPADGNAIHIKEIRVAEAARVVDLQSAGKWKHLWRSVGRLASFAVLDVEDHEELHEILSMLPLFAYMKVQVTPLARHPSAI